jgi:hypothetical protein
MSVAWPAEPGHPRLVNEDPSVGKREAFLRRATREEQRGNGCGLSDAGGDDVRLHKLHGVVDRESRSNRTAGRIDVQLNVFLGILGLEEQHLRGREIGDVVVNGRADKDDVFFKEAGINVVGALSAAGLFDHHGYKRRPAVFRFVEVFHLGD